MWYAARHTASYTRRQARCDTPREGAIREGDENLEKPTTTRGVVCHMARRPPCTTPYATPREGAPREDHHVTHEKVQDISFFYMLIEKFDCTYHKKTCYNIYNGWEMKTLVQPHGETTHRVT